VAKARAASPVGRHERISLNFEPRHPGFERAVRASFARQGVLAAWGAEMVEVAPGRVVLRLAFSARVTQQQGFFHGGVVASLGDSAGGYAAMTMLEAGLEIVSVEYKVNFLAPASGEALVATGQLIRAGKRLLVSTTEVDVWRDGVARPCALLQQTLAPVMPGAARAAP
jgi:uncharacterized protein (TIGR00369 family)